MGSQQHDDAIAWYSAALSLGRPITHVLIKRSKLYMQRGLWKDALDDANQVRRPRLMQVHCRRSMVRQYLKIRPR